MSKILKVFVIIGGISNIILTIHYITGGELSRFYIGWTLTSFVMIYWIIFYLLFVEN